MTYLYSNNIIFEYGTPFQAYCYGGIEHMNCNNKATWTQSSDNGHSYDALLCDRCKIEVETYIKNVPRYKGD